MQLKHTNYHNNIYVCTQNKHSRIEYLSILGLVPITKLIIIDFGIELR